MVRLAPWAASLAGAAQAQDAWPGKPISYVVPYPPGGTTDFLARLICTKLGEALNTRFVINARR